MFGERECLSDFTALFHGIINGAVNQKTMVNVPCKIQFNIRMLSQPTSWFHFDDVLSAED